MIPDNVILQQSKDRNCFYLYEERVMLERIAQLKHDFKGVDFLFSVKANPAPAVLDCMFGNGFGADAASLAEVMLAKGRGVKKEDILYSAPGKSVKDIEEALPHAIIVADSVDEVARINEAAGRFGEKAKIGLRINPSFTFRGKGGVPQKFGIDAEKAFEMLPEWEQMENIEIEGVHVHLMSQVLDTKLIARYYERLFKYTADFAKELGRPLGFLNLGSGIGIPFGPGDDEVDTQRLGQTVSSFKKIFSDRLEGTRIIIETGRFVCGPAGTYCTKVMDRKESRGRTFIILYNTLNGFARPCFEMAARYFGGDQTPEGYEPLFTTENSYEFIALTDSPEVETVTLVGNLCTNTDIIAREISMPKLKAGDVLVVTNAGCYGATLSPFAFSSFGKPAELFLKTDGTVLET